MNAVSLYDGAGNRTTKRDSGALTTYTCDGANQLVTVTLTDTNGAVDVPSTPLSGNTNSSGQFSVEFTSATAGQVIGNATTSFTVNGATETRSTEIGRAHV